MISNTIHCTAHIEIYCTGIESLEVQHLQDADGLHVNPKYANHMDNTVHCTAL